MNTGNEKDWVMNLAIDGEPTSRRELFCTFEEAVDEAECWLEMESEFDNNVYCALIGEEGQTVWENEDVCEMLCEEEVEAMALRWGDDKLSEVIDPSQWTQPVRMGPIKHKSGCKVEVTGTSGRFVAVDPKGNALRGDGGGVRYFGGYSTAILALCEAGHLSK